MPTEQEQIIAVFKQFVEAGLVEKDAQKALAVIADDIIGVGMGEQGMVTCKADAARILGAGRADAEKSTTTIEYVTILTRLYAERYGVVCGIIQITTTSNGKTVQSKLGQLINVRKDDDKWLIFVAEATPIFEQIEEMEAYPIKFAENVLERYRQQEQIAQNVQSDSIAMYAINFTQGVFESSFTKVDFVVSAEKGTQYEKLVFGTARANLSEGDRYRFMSTFSIGNVLKAYQCGQTELSMEYEMLRPKEPPIWLKTVVRLYTDRADENLKGYLYVFDIDKEKRRELELQNKAEVDSLTGLYNKSSAEQKIAEKLESVSPADPCAFLMIDLDYFKSINDTYGHQEGDRIIREAAEVIRSLTRRGDIAGRVGGDEFCIHFQGGLTPALIKQRAESLCEAIRRITTPDGKSISCSIGLVFSSGYGTQFNEMYQKADAALYEQKKKGRNGLTICPDIM